MAGRGLKAMEQAVKNISASKGGGGRRFSYFGLDEDDSIILRFITDVDEILTCDFYEYVKATIDGKTVSQSFIVAPDYYADDPDWKGDDWVLKYGGQCENYNTKELEQPKAKERTVAIAVEREAIPIESTGGRPKFKYQDKMIDITYKDKEGNEQTTKGLNFILVRKDAKTFWGNVVGYASEFGTLVDRDYKIKRVGKQLATNFTCTPAGTEEDWEDLEELRQRIYDRYGYGKDVGRDSEERFLTCPMTLDEWAEDQASEERAKSLLTGAPRADAQARRSESNGSHRESLASSDDEAQAAPPPVTGDVSALRARLEAHK